MGGVGQWSDLVDGIRQGGADAAAAGNIFHYSEHSTKKAKEFMLASGLPMRGSMPVNAHLSTSSCPSIPATGYSPG
jgi:hypothetical protein